MISVCFDGSMIVIPSCVAVMMLVEMSFLVVTICETWLGSDVVTAVGTDNDGVGANL